MQNCNITRVGPIESTYMLIVLKVDEELSQTKNVIRILAIMDICYLDITKNKILFTEVHD